MGGADSVVHEVGWPFLVAAGRVRDFTVLVAPDFLVACGEQGLLGIVGSAVEGGPVESRSVRTSSARADRLVCGAAADAGRPRGWFGRARGRVGDGAGRVRAAAADRRGHGYRRGPDGRPGRRRRPRGEARAAGLPPVPDRRGRIPGRAVHGAVRSFGRLELPPIGSRSSPAEHALLSAVGAPRAQPRSWSWPLSSRSWWLRWCSSIRRGRRPTA